MTMIAAWALKRSVVARMRRLAAGGLAPWPGTEMLADGDPQFCVPVQVEYVLPAAPDRLCVYGTQVRAARRQLTAEPSGRYQGGQAYGMYVETVSLEFRIRCYQPGEDVEAVDAVTSRLCQAVTAAVVNGPVLFEHGSIVLANINQDPTALAPNPEPSVITNVSLLFVAEVIVP